MDFLNAFALLANFVIVPALAYFLLGYLFWLIATKRPSWRYALAAGLLFGLAMVTKGQYSLLIPVVVAVALVSNYLGFARGFAKGARHTNLWWVEQKSIYYDTHQIIQKRQLKNHDCL